MTFSGHDDSTINIGLGLLLLLLLLVNLRLFCVRNKLTCVTEYISEYQINARDAQSECW